MVMRWRLIRSPALSGAWNMAIDEAMLLAHAAGLTPPTFRLYSWSPPAVSLGLLQPADVVNEPVCRQLGIDLVRRPSGGGAVLHQHEVTYAVVADGRLCPDGSSVLATYRWLARGLMEGLKLLGIDATLPESLWETKTPSRSLSFCFVRLTGADLEVGGKKLGGSAQARRRFFLLQHGCIPLRLENEILARLFGSLHLDTFTSVELVAGRRVSPDEFAEALVRGFERALKVQFHEGELTEAELQAARLLMEGKYGTREWLLARKVAPNLREELNALFPASDNR